MALARELTITVAVLAERRKAASRWAGDYWIPVGVAPSASRRQEGDILFEDDKATRFFMGVADLTCHAAETEAYVHNFNSRAPALFVVLRRDTENAHPLPWYVHAVTASPYLAQDFADSGEDIVERVAMPAEIETAIKDFVERHHKEEVFRKRRRDSLDTEKLKFGKEPIFLRRPKPGRDRLDG